MSERLGVAVVGAGVIGRTHVKTLAQHDRLRLAALVDPVLTSAQLAESYGVPWFPDVPALLSSGIARAAIVATPNETHLPVTESLLRAGLPVLLEKPVAESLASALKLIGIADDTGIPVLVGHHRRHNPIVRKAREIILSGQIGDLVIANVVCSLYKPEDYFDAKWRKTPGAGGPLLINLVHEIDLLRHFFGEIAEVKAITSHRQRSFEVEDGAAVCLTFANGALATLVISDSASGPWAWDLTSGENLARFPAHHVTAHHYAGTRGALSLPDLTLWLPEGEPDWTKKLRPESIPVAPANPYSLQLSHFADLIEGAETSPRVSLRDATANMIVIDAIRRAAGDDGRIAIDLSSLSPQGLAHSNGNRQ